VSKISDFYTKAEFSEMLDSAEAKAQTKWDISFVNDMREKFDEYGVDTYLTEGQKKQFERITEE
jgi:hypothetical protein